MTKPGIIWACVLESGTRIDGFPDHWGEISELQPCVYEVGKHGLTEIVMLEDHRLALLWDDAGERVFGERFVVWVEFAGPKRVISDEEAQGE